MSMGLRSIVYNRSDLARMHNCFYNVMLVSAVQQRESTLCIHMFPNS